MKKAVITIVSLTIIFSCFGCKGDASSEGSKSGKVEGAQIDHSKASTESTQAKE